MNDWLAYKFIKETKFRTTGNAYDGLYFELKVHYNIKNSLLAPERTSWNRVGVQVTQGARIMKNIVNQ